MKTVFLFAAISLALSVSATTSYNFGRGNNHNHREAKHGPSNSTSTALTIASTSTPTGGASNANPTSTGAGAAAGSADPQSSLTLAKQVIATGFENNGQDPPAAGQVPSLTSSNNFINFCLTVPNLPITNGKQIATGSCNPAPMGVIPSSDNMPSAKFIFPKNGDTSVVENTAFTIQMAIQNFQSGSFVNAEQNYFAAPQQVNAKGQIIGHSHVVIEPLSAIDQTTPTNPKQFAFFQGLNAAAVGGVLTAKVSSGLPAGFYRLSSINTAANHQPVVVPIAQRGALDDAVYFTVKSNGGGGGGGGAPVASASAASPPAQPTQRKQGKGSRALN